MSKRKSPLQAMPHKLRLEGDDLYQWAQLVQQFESVRQTFEGFAVAMKEKYGFTDEEFLDPRGFIVRKSPDVIARERLSAGVEASTPPVQRSPGSGNQAQGRRTGGKAPPSSAEPQAEQ